MTNTEQAFYPEMILNVRDRSYVETHTTSRAPGFRLNIVHEKPLQKLRTIVISRLDGNHRLWFADGHEKAMEPIDRPVSFCLLTIEDREKELEVFRDINDNQMGMNTSHLQNITARLLGDKLLEVQKPTVVYHAEIDEGQRRQSLARQSSRRGKGGKEGATLSGLTVANLTSAVNDMLTRSTKLSSVSRCRRAVQGN